MLPFCAKADPAYAQAVAKALGSISGRTRSPRSRPPAGDADPRCAIPTERSAPGET